MRVLVAFAGGRGHLLPMIPLARALRAAGHELAQSGHPRRVDPPGGGLFGEVFPHDLRPSTTERPPGTGVLEPVDLDHEFAVIGRWFAGELAGRNRERTTRVLESWRPDVVLCDEMDFGSIAAAQQAGVPVAVVDCIASGALTRAEYVAGPLAELGIGAWKGDLEICPFPPSLRDPDFPVSPGAAFVRPEEPEPEGPCEAAAWLADSPGPRVYLTLGTIFNSSSGDLFARLVEGLVRLGGRVLVTVGADLDPADIGPVGEGVRVERFVPQASVLPWVDLVVNHGGSGSVVGALGHGLPLVIVPMGADQQLNAQRVSALRAGRALDALHVQSDEVHATATGLLADPVAREAARRIAVEVAALPAPAALVPRLEALAGR